MCADAIAFGRDLNDRRVIADAVKFVPNTAEAALTVHADHLGSPQKMTDGAGAVVWDAAYKPFGEDAATSGAATNNQRFPGQYFDAETSLHYNWMRDYDATLGRYLQSDPIGLDGGLNTYAYVGGNPGRFSDPTGELIGLLFAFAPAAAVAGSGAAGAVADFGTNYNDMRNANFKNSDKYFHCKANCEAAQRGKGGELVACVISDVREATDQYVKGDPRSASIADQLANHYGRGKGSANKTSSCREICEIFRPLGLPSRF